MSQLLIRFLRLTVVTNGGSFGCAVPFSEGLNVIRAENTSGKSTLLNSICYALGLESILGRSGPLALKPAVRSRLEFNNRTFSVLESDVELECANQNGEVITVKRQITGNQDERLVTLNRAARLSEPSAARNYIDEFFYVRDPGAAQRELGFHSFLANFLGLTLPLTETYDGGIVPLYLECIFPLLFIEQKRGWSNLQATIPTKYRIRNAAKAALEHTLSLDVPENLKKKVEIEVEKEQTKSGWRALRSTLEFISQDIGGILNNFPASPITSMEESRLPYVTILDGNDWLSLNDWIYKMRETLMVMKDNLEGQSEQIENQDQNMKEQLENLENELLFSEAAAAEARDEYFEEEMNRNLLERRLTDLNSDLVKNQDALKLQRFGADLQASLSTGQCPTCHQPVVDTLLEQPGSQVPMTIEANIDFIKGQREAARLLLNQSEKLLSIKGLKYRKRVETTEVIRQQIKDIKSNLTNRSGIPNISLVRDIIANEEKLQRTENAREKVKSLLDEVVGLSARWNAVLRRESELPKDYFSELDKVKLAKLTALFRKNVALFGFRTVNPDLIQVSPDTYRPTIEGFEITFDASASDNIRVIWAYTLALQEMAEDFDTNHWRVTFFDEPGQQQVSRASREAFYKEAAHLRKNQQVIATTSERTENLVTFLGDVEHKMIEFGDKVLRPLAQP